MVNKIIKEIHLYWQCDSGSGKLQRLLRLWNAW